MLAAGVVGVVLLAVLAGCQGPLPVTSQTGSMASPPATAAPTDDLLGHAGSLAAVWGEVPKECT